MKISFKITLARVKKNKSVVINLVVQLIGWTPLIEMKNIAKKEGIQARLVGKMEAYQPLFSVKDRTALG